MEVKSNDFSGSSWFILVIELDDNDDDIMISVSFMIKPCETGEQDIIFVWILIDFFLCLIEIARDLDCFMIVTVWDKDFFRFDTSTFGLIFKSNI